MQRDHRRPVLPIDRPSDAPTMEISVNPSRLGRLIVRPLVVGSAALVAASAATVIVPATATASAATGPPLSVFAGTGTVGAPTPGPATSSALDIPNGVAFDPSGDVYIADSGNNEVDKVTPSGTLSVFAGTGTAGAPTPGPATSSSLDGPGGVAVDPSGDVYIGDSGNNEVEKVTPSGTLSIFAGRGIAGAPTPGPATSSSLDSLNQIAVDPSGDVYIADSGNDVVEKVTSSGRLSIFAGRGTAGTPTPGPATSSALNYPGGVTVGPSGDVFIADFGNDVVEKVTPSGTLSIFAGKGSSGAPPPGPATSSALGGPAFVAADSSGTVYIADYGADVVERVTPTGTLSIFAGRGTAGTPTPGAATSSALDEPVGVAVDPSGDVYIGDSSNNVVEKVTLPVPTMPTIGNLPSSGTVGDSFTPMVVTSGDGATWVTSDTSAVCSVTGTTVSFVGAGACTLTAQVGVGAIFGAASGVPQAVSVTVPEVVAQCTGGYWIATADGTVHPFGSAADYGSLARSGITPEEPVVGIAATPDCKGFWLVAADGGLFAFGDAGFFGSMGGRHLDQPVVGMAGTPQGGYYEVAADGGLFAFGPGAAFHGSMGGQRLHGTVVGMAVDPTGGYYEVAADGGVFSFGAPFHGSTGCLDLARPIVAIVVSEDTTAVGGSTACGSAGTQAPGGYQLAAGDGGVFSFGDTDFAGSLGGEGANDVVGMADA